MDTWMRDLVRAYHVFSIYFSFLMYTSLLFYTWVNEVDRRTLLPTTRYTLLRAASWKRPAEGCSWPDHGGTAAVRTAGGTLWHRDAGSAWPAQVGQVMTLNEHIWGPYEAAWSFWFSFCRCQGVSHPCREDGDGSQPEEAIPWWRGGHR